MEAKKEKLEFYGGKVGVCLPFASLVVFIFTLVLTNHVSLKVFWTAGFFSLCISFLFAKDQKAFNKAAVRSLVDPMFSTFILIFFLAGILSYALRQSGLINGLLWLCTSLNINAGFLPVITFLICVVISTSCGTTGGTVSTVTPIMFPLAVSMGCNPALMLGCIISGSYFGDNLAPISDTTIAAAGSMKVDVLKVVRDRMKYSLIAGSVAIVLYIIFGLRNTAPVVNTSTIDPMYAKTLILLVVPLIMIILMFKGFELVPVMLICDMVAIILDVAFGFVTFDKLISTEGPIVAGIESMLSVIVFTAFVFILLGFTRESGVFETLIDHLSHACTTRRQAELTSAGLVVLSLLLTGINTVSIVIAGPIVNALCRRFSIDRRRGANILSGYACGGAGVLPYNSSLMMMFGLATATGFVPEGFSIVRLIPYSFHCIMLLIVYTVCILTGFGSMMEDYSTIPEE